MEKVAILAAYNLENSIGEIVWAKIHHIKDICKVERGTGKEIVVLQGLGFVGAMMAAVAADCEIKGKAPYFVLEDTDIKIRKRRKRKSQDF